MLTFESLRVEVLFVFFFFFLKSYFIFYANTKLHIVIVAGALCTGYNNIHYHNNYSYPIFTIITITVITAFATAI